MDLSRTIIFLADPLFSTTNPVVPQFSMPAFRARHGGDPEDTALGEARWWRGAQRRQASGFLLTLGSDEGTTQATEPL